MNELKFEDLQEINGGGWKDATDVIVGTVGLGLSPFAVGTLGPAAAWDMASTSIDLIKHGAHK